MLCGWGVKSGWFIPYIDKRVGGRLTRVVPERFREEYHTHYKALHKCTVYLLVMDDLAKSKDFRWRLEVFKDASLLQCLTETSLCS